MTIQTEKKITLIHISSESQYSIYYFICRIIWKIIQKTSKYIINKRNYKSRNG